LIYGLGGGCVRLFALNTVPSGTGAIQAQYLAGMVATTELRRTTRWIVGLALQLSSKLSVPFTAGAMKMASASDGLAERWADGIGLAMWMTCVMSFKASE